MAHDYYKTLGIGRNASDEDIKRAYRRLAKQYHPDANPNNPAAEARFKEISEAYATLVDNARRARYDNLRANPSHYQRPTRPPQGSAQSSAQSNPQSKARSSDPSRARGYAQRAGASGGSTANANSARQQHHSARDSVREQQQTARQQKAASPDADAKTESSGGFSEVLESLFGFGRGGKRRPSPDGKPGADVEREVVISLREAHDGTTRNLTKGDRRIKVSIPPGSTDGTRVRLANEGEASPEGGPNGDLYLIIAVEPDPDFRREGDDLYVELDLDMFTATLGGEVHVRTLGRPVRLRVPPGTQSGRQLRVSGRGMPRLRSDQRGDLYARVRVVVPENLTPQQTEALRRLQAQISPPTD